jgi:hypothetical protein
MPTLETAVERQPIAEKGNANFTPTNLQMQVRVFRDQYARVRDTARDTLSKLPPSILSFPVARFKRMKKPVLRQPVCNNAALAMLAFKKIKEKPCRCQQGS